MPVMGYIRARLIKLVKQEGHTVRRKLLKRFNLSDRPQADIEIGRLLSDGVFIITGTGTRGRPKEIHLSPIFSVTRCPFCLKETTICD